MFKTPRTTDVEPTLTPGDGNYASFYLDHPAFAQVSIGRVQGGAVLYGSDFDHHNYIRLTISRSQLMRNHNSDHHMEKNELIDIAMSESQFATLISTMNQGGGAPCTITHIAGERAPTIPRRDIGKVYSNEVAQDTAEAVAALNELLAAIDTQGLSKVKAEALKGLTRQALRKLEDSIPFVARQFDKHAEKTVEAAKMEIQGYMNFTMKKAGYQVTVDAAPLLDVIAPADQG